MAEYLLVPGDPERVDKIAKLWNSAKKVSDHREFRSLTSKYKGIPVSALSSGIGPACMSIAINEAASIGGILSYALEAPQPYRRTLNVET